MNVIEKNYDHKDHDPWNKAGTDIVLVKFESHMAGFGMYVAGAIEARHRTDKAEDGSEIVTIQVRRP